MNEIASINWGLILPLFFIQGVLLIFAILDWAKQGENVRGNRWIWFVVIIFINIIGPVTYFIIGRRRG